MVISMYVRRLKPGPVSGVLDLHGHCEEASENVDVFVFSVAFCFGLSLPYLGAEHGEIAFLLSQKRSRELSLRFESLAFVGCHISPKKHRISPKKHCVCRAAIRIVRLALIRGTSLENVKV